MRNRLRGLGHTRGYVGLLVVGVLIGAVAFWLVDRGFGAASPPSADLLPGDYLYLDDERVDAYLGQLELGRYANETRSSTTTRKRQASVDAKGVIQVGATGEEQESVQRVATATATDRFYRFLGRLTSQFSGALNLGEDGYLTLDLSGPYEELLEGAKATDEGLFVRLDNARLKVPAYARAFPRLLYARQSTREGTPRIKASTLTRLVAQQRTSLNRYLRRVGSDALVPAVAYVPDPGGDGGYTFFVPLRYSKLVDSPSLLSGRVTVVGKVVRQVQLPDDPASPARYDDYYFDPQLALTYRRALAGIPRPVRIALGIPRSRRRQRTIVSETVSVRPPGMLVQPVAIFK